MRKLFTKSLLTAAVTAAIAMPVQAYNLHSSDAGELNLDVEAIFGVFSSEETYGNTASSPSWQEAYVKYGLSGHKNIENGQLYGAVNLLSAGAWGDGEASGTTNGNERGTEFEDIYAGFRNDMFDLSIGRQNITIGDGFLMNGDSLNFGEAIDQELSRDGAYWLAGRKAFDKTIWLKVGGEEGLRSDVFWFESDNKAQGRPEMAGINVEHNSEMGTFGAMYLKGLDTNATGIAGGAFDNLKRDGQSTFSLRYQGNAGVENLFLSTEYASQSQGDNSADADAWYVEAGWTFADVAWSPSVNYRYSTFDNNYDQLFTGFNRGYGTWFQGEVWANYSAAGPGNTGVDIHHVAVKAQPSETLALGALYFDIDDTSNTAARAGGAKELNLYAEWVANDHLIISPLIGFYTPEKDNGAQGNGDTNTYFQVLAIVPF